MIDVILYSKDGCPYCQYQKEWFDEQGISYIEKNIKEKKYLNELSSFNVGGVPFTIIRTSEKEHKLLGFNKTELQNIFSKVI